jgi:hypothetical protein
MKRPQINFVQRQKNFLPVQCEKKESLLPRFYVSLKIIPKTDIHSVFSHETGIGLRSSWVRVPLCMVGRAWTSQRAAITQDHSLSVEGWPLWKWSGMITRERCLWSTFKVWPPQCNCNHTITNFMFDLIHTSHINMCWEHSRPWERMTHEK